MFEDGWKNLPPEVLLIIFYDIPTKYLLQSVIIVCKSWNNILYHSGFWIKKALELGLTVNSKLRKVFFEHDKEEEIIRILQAGCFYKEESHIIHYRIFMPQVSGLDWEITENYLIEATSYILFRNSKTAPTQISLELRTNPTHLSHLILLLKLVKLFDCKICIDDIYSWRMCYPASKEILRIICDANASVRLKSFRGCIENVDILPSSLEKLSLSIICPDGSVAEDGKIGTYKSIANDPGISRFTENFNVLGQLRVHIKALMDVSHFGCLPFVVMESSEVYLYLSGVGDEHIQWVCSLTKNMQPCHVDDLGCYWCLVFPSSNLSKSGVKKLLLGLSSAGVRVQSTLVVSSPLINEDDAAELHMNTIRFLPRCKGFVWHEMDENFKWYHGW